MKPYITQVAASDSFVLELVFDNGDRRLFDMKPYLNSGIFQPLKDQELFRTAHISGDTVAWAGEIKLDPWFVYDNSWPEQKTK